VTTEEKEGDVSRYLLAVHMSGDEPRDPTTDDEMRRSLAELDGIEEEMTATGAWVFSGRLHGPDATTVVRAADGNVLTTDGPFAETKEVVGGFYIVEAADLDAALAWAAKVTAAIGAPIEVRPFAGTGRLREQAAL
jgi:hypothetical protein